MSFRPRSLPFEDWPLTHQERWMKALEQNGPFRRSGRAAHWRPDSIKKTRKGYGVWLYWNMIKGISIHDHDPESLVSEGSVDAYLSTIEEVNNGWTPYNRAQELYDAIRVMTPHLNENSWHWLRTGCDNLRQEAIPFRNKTERLKMAWQIEELALRLINEAETAPGKNYHFEHGITTLERAQLYRDGLALLIMIRRPFRIKNFSRIRMGQHLFFDDDQGTLTFSAAETKGKRRAEAPIPEHVIKALHRYVNHFRKILLTTSGKAKHIQTNALWISRDGTELAEGSLHNVFRRRTEREFGKPIPPHWFRDIDVTTLTRHSPEDACITGTILHHSDPEIANRHYNHSLHIDAAKRHVSALNDWLDPALAP